MRCVAAIAFGCATSAMGCVNEYHPEYHPETTYSYAQNIVTVTAPPPAPAPILVFASASPPSTPTTSSPAGPAHRYPREHHLPRAVERQPTGEARAMQLAPMFTSDDSRGSGE